ncbi:MAG: hypothetical protein AB1746_07245 [Candidatus Zixiibacteriota bacterium]
MAKRLLILFVVFISGVNAGDGKKSLFAVFDMENQSESGNYRERSLTAMAGDSLAAYFSPTLEINAWEKECSFNINLVPLDYESITSASRSMVDNKARIDCVANDNMIISLFQLADGSLEWQMQFDNIPKSNTLKFSFDSRNLRFFYQDSALFTGDQKVSGPDWAQGSYAVYHADRRNNYRLFHSGDTLTYSYMTGKAFHIRRPIVYDNRGESAWCRIDIDTLAGIMTLEIPESFLNNAAYPIVVDPTFGKTSAGAWNLTFVNYRHTVLWNVGQAETGQGEITGGFVYCDVIGNLEEALQVKVHSYSKGGDLNGTRLHSSSATTDITDTSVHWQECAMSGALQEEKTYIASLQAYNTINNKLRVYADVTDWGDVKYYDLADWSVPDSLSGYSSKNDGFSVYIEYTIEAGSGQSSVRRRKILSADDAACQDNEINSHFTVIKGAQICEKQLF